MEATEGADMGTREDAEAKFMAAVDQWIALRQPHMSDRAGHKKREMNEHEARFQLANAAAHLAWFMRSERAREIGLRKTLSS